MKKPTLPFVRVLFKPGNGRYIAGNESRMKKYWHVLNIGIQNNLTYRVNFLFRTLFGLIPLMAILYLWRAIYAGKGADASVGSYSLSQMIPIDYLAYRLCLFFSGRVTYLAVAALPLALFILWLRRYVVLPADWSTLAFFFISTILTALLQFFTSYAMAMLAFWVLEVSTFIFILFAFEYIASGHMFPLDILPRGLEQTLYFTPFPYQMYFPVSIYMGKAAGADLLRGLLIQTFWVIAAYCLARFAWRRGIKKYSAVGG